MSRFALAVATITALVLVNLAAGAASADVFTYRSVLTAGAEVPKPTAPKGAGGVFTSTVTKDGARYSISWKLTFRKLSGPAVAAHVHRGRAGVAGGVILALCGPCRNGQTGKATITKAVAEAMRRGTAYANVHTARNAAGEIRGQAKLTGTTLGQPGTPPGTDPAPPPPTDPPPDY